MRTTVALDPATRDRLNELKQAWGAKSVEDVIARLLSGAPVGAKALYDARRAAVDAALRRHRVKRLVAFGSRARGDARPDSDLDVAFDAPAGMTLLDLVRFKDALEEAFGLPVNLVTTRGMSARLRRHVDADGVVLVG